MPTKGPDQIDILTRLTDAEAIASRLQEMLNEGFCLNDNMGELKMTPVLKCVFAGGRGGNLVLAELLRLGANQNVQNSHGRLTPVMSAIKGDTDLLQTLLEAGADTEIQDNEGQTVLHWAAGKLNPNAVALLLRYGANPIHRDRANQSAADKARASGIDWTGEAPRTLGWSPQDQAASDAAIAARVANVVALLEDTEAAQ